MKITTKKQFETNLQPKECFDSDIKDTHFASLKNVQDGLEAGGVKVGVVNHNVEELACCDVCLHGCFRVDEVKIFTISFARQWRPAGIWTIQKKTKVKSTREGKL